MKCNFQMGIDFFKMQYYFISSKTNQLINLLASIEFFETKLRLNEKFIIRQPIVVFGNSN